MKMLPIYDNQGRRVGEEGDEPKMRLLGDSAAAAQRNNNSSKVRSKIEEARIESMYFRRRFFQARHSQ
jgi:hypothetical protein